MCRDKANLGKESGGDQTQTGQQTRATAAPVSAARRISYAGVAAALILLALLLCRLLPTGRLTVLVITSLVLMLVVDLVDLRAGLICFVGTGLLAVPLIGLPQSWPFLIFFGPWPLLKSLIEERLSRSKLLIPGSLFRFWCVGAMAKLPVFLLLITLAFAVFRSFVTPAIKLWGEKFGIGVPILALFLLVGALLYDFILSVLLAEYRSRLKPLFMKRRSSRF